MNRPSDRCGSGGARVTAHDTDTPKGLVSPYRIVRLIPSRSYCYCPKSTEAALSQSLPESGTDLPGSSARPGRTLRPAGRPPPDVPVEQERLGCFPGDDETASPLCQARDACVTGQPSDSSLIVIAPLRAWFLGYPWYTECTPESCAAGKDGAAGERALLSRAACCELLESARLRASQ